MVQRRTHPPPPARPGLPDSASSPWGGMRRPLQPADLRLTITAARWIASLDGAIRPMELALRYPRLANQLCLHWHDTIALLNLLDDLTHDRRGGRQGFPPGVRQELEQLHSHVIQRPTRGSGH